MSHVEMRKKRKVESEKDESLALCESGEEIMYQGLTMLPKGYISLAEIVEPLMLDHQGKGSIEPEAYVRCLAKQLIFKRTQKLALPDRESAPTFAVLKRFVDLRNIHGTDDFFLVGNFDSAAIVLSALNKCYALPDGSTISNSKHTKALQHLELRLQEIATLYSTTRWPHYEGTKKRCRDELTTTVNPFAGQCSEESREAQHNPRSFSSDTSDSDFTDESVTEQVDRKRKASTGLSKLKKVKKSRSYVMCRFESFSDEIQKRVDKLSKVQREATRCKMLLDDALEEGSHPLNEHLDNYLIGKISEWRNELKFDEVQ